MHRLLFLFLILIFMIEKSHSSIEYRETRDNYCSKVVGYHEEEIVPETQRITETYKTLCWSITFTCTKHRFKTVVVNKTVTVYKTKRVYECCPGYEKKNDSCIPVCRLGCDHGICVEPDTCLCEPGWREPFCTSECEPKKYGRGCKDNCTCFHGASCDKETGLCHCTEGFTGKNCEFPCPINTYGQNCLNQCLCKNDAICDIVNGSCECRPGYEGEYCEKKCDVGIFGQYCENLCICIPENTESCHHVDGKCICRPGYRGNYCEHECDDFTYGENCSMKCECENSYFCDSFDGTCYCEPGWIGETCSEKCPSGKFGDNCTFECVECMKTMDTCDHVTGYCNCLAGFYGTHCENVCLPGFWGTNCSNVCECDGGLECNPIYGCVNIPTYSGLEENKVFLVATVLVAIILTSFVVAFWVIGKKKYLATSGRPSSPVRRIFFLIFKTKKTKKPNFMPSTNITNPVYENPQLILDSADVGNVSIRGSFSGEVKYFKSNANELSGEKRTSKAEKRDVLEANKEKKSDLKSRDSGKSQVLSAIGVAIHEKMRSSKHKMDSKHLSQIGLDQDFQPEKLDDFNVIENIYEKPIPIENSTMKK